MKLARNASKPHQTRCSVVFDPDKKEIFVCLDGNIDKMGRISLENQTIETLHGYAAFRRETIPAEGLSAADLAEWWIGDNDKGM